MTHKIQANASGTRSIEVSDQHLQTLRRYQLLDNLVGSDGIIDETIVDKLKLTVRSLLSGAFGSDKDLLDLCLDVIYNKHMKAFLRICMTWSKMQSCRIYLHQHSRRDPESDCFGRIYNSFSDLRSFRKKTDKILCSEVYLAVSVIFEAVELRIVPVAPAKLHGHAAI